ncbi:MAG: hypothetical protein K9N23_12550 [Akkermansiaceae bacterium]|nr:hypothetical protein [Akkermansiaceae bacterium]
MTRQQELIAQRILTRPNGVAEALRQRRWADLATAVEFAQADVPKDLAITDPALYRTLRQHITTFYLRGGGALNLDKLRHLANPPN